MCGLSRKPCGAWPASSHTQVQAGRQWRASATWKVSHLNLDLTYCSNNNQIPRSVPFYLKSNVFSLPQQLDLQGAGAVA